MTTVTRLKISVDNDRLPVLTSEGPKNYYVGRYLIAVEGLGGSLTQAEKAAIENLLENAFEHEWIDMVDYFFPFIGSSSKPATGFLPLIDKGCGYSLDNFVDNNVAFESAGDSFAYNVNNRIVKYGVNAEGTGFIVNGSIKHNNNKVSFVIGLDPTVPLSAENVARMLTSKNEGDTKVFSLRTGIISQEQDIRDLYVARMTRGEHLPVPRIPRPLLSVSDEYICHFCGYSNTAYCRGTFDKTNTEYNTLYMEEAVNVDNVEFNYGFGYGGASNLCGFFYAAFLNKIPTAVEMRIMHTDFLQFMTELGRI